MRRLRLLVIVRFAAGSSLCTLRAVDATTRPGRAPRSSKPIPETKERYPGTSGKTQGDVNETKPAANAIASPAGPSSITSLVSPHVGPCG